MPSILFVCYANRIRSPLAAGFLRSKLAEAGLGGDWHVQSAGTWPESASPIPPALLRRLNEAGFPMEEHNPLTVSENLLMDQDLIMVMEKGQKEALESEFPRVRGRIFLLSEVAEGLEYDIPDPGRGGRSTNVETARDLKGLVEKGFEEICRRAANPAALSDSHA